MTGVLVCLTYGPTRMIYGAYLFDCLSFKSVTWQVFGADEEHACHQRIEGGNDDHRQRKVDDELEHCVESRVGLPPLLWADDAHLVLNARPDQIHEGEADGHDPDGTGDHHSPHGRWTPVTGHRVDDDHIAFATQCGQREDRHSERQRCEELVQLADALTVRPLDEGVDRRTERYGDKDE